MTTRKKGMRILFCVTAIMFLSLFSIVARGATEAVVPQIDRSLEVQNWDEIERLAKQEGKVYVYNVSGRMSIAGEAFQKKYGIEVISGKMSGSDITERVMREQEAKVYQVDAIMTDDLLGIAQLLLPKGYVWNFVPDVYKDVLAQGDQDPLKMLVELRILGFNNETYPDGAPITNLWELTTERWRGKFFLRDPEITTVTTAFFAEIIARSDDMAAAYKDLFGREITLTTENAGWEFIKRLAQNNPITLSSDTDVGNAVGAKGQSDPPIGLYVISKHRDIVTQNLALEAALKVQPFIGYQLPVYFLQVTNGPNPNAAKLFTRFLFTNEGAQAWTRDLGCFSPNTSLAYNEEIPLGGLKEWQEITVGLSIENATTYVRRISDFWLLHRN